MASAYERARLAQIARNQAELLKLKVTPLHEDEDIAKRARRNNNKNKTTTKNLNRNKGTPKTAVLPRRSSRKRKAATAAADPIEQAKQWMTDHSFSGGGAAKHKNHLPQKKKKAKTKRLSKNMTLFPRREEELVEYEKPAFYILREWKRARAKELGYNDPCVICHNRTLIEMVRARPTNKTEMLAIWGIGETRFAKHGELMLAALEPLRADLDTHAAVNATADLVSGSKSSGSTAVLSTARTRALGDGVPHPDWVTAQQRDGLADAPWRTRRSWCAGETGCQSCLSHGNVPDGQNWGGGCRPFLAKAVQVYGTLEGPRDAGWRWDAKPNHTHSSHNHRWWPPHNVVATAPFRVKVPMTSGQALSFLRGMEEDAALALPPE